jgi:hypothetical protein
LLLRWWGMDDFNISVARLKKNPQGQSIGWRLINKDAKSFRKSLAREQTTAGLCLYLFSQTRVTQFLFS